MTNNSFPLLTSLLATVFFFICSSSLSLSEESINKNEVLLEAEGVGRSLLTLHYSGQMALLKEDIRLFGSIGVAPFTEAGFPSFPLGLSVRAGNPKKEGLRSELGFYAVIGGESSSLSNVNEVDKFNTIDFVTCWGLVSESESFLFKMMLGVVHDYAVDENLTLGLSLGYRF